MEEDGSQQSEPLRPRCAGSAVHGPGRDQSANSGGSGFFTSAHWSADGTSVVTASEDHSLRTYVLPTDLLTSLDHQHLEPYNVVTAPEPVYAATLYPFYELSKPSTTLILSSTRDHPIRLHNALQPSQLASYSLINATTEDFICPHSLLFTPSGTHFLAGSDSLISCFDISRSGEGPVQRLPTIPSKRKKIVGGGVGMKGRVSALNVSSDGIVAAGTYTRNVGLYSDEGRGDCVSVFSVASDPEDEQAGRYIGGTGVTQVAWSPDGRYLYVAERMSDGIVVFDIRVEGKRLGALRGRKAVTNQRMAFDVVPTAEGHEIWAGGMDGCVRVWKDPHLGEGMQNPSFDWAAHDDVVSSAVVHPMGTVAATCSGSRKMLSDLGHSGLQQAHSMASSHSSIDGDILHLSSDASLEGFASRGGHGFEECFEPLKLDYSLKLWQLSSSS